jgi:branched-chain amino acid aminotransferase
MLSTKKAIAKGYSQCLWLFNGQVVEVGASNIFFVMKGDDGKKELLTPELDGLILPGVTRDSILVSYALTQQYVSKKGNYKVTERKVMIDEII